MKKAVKFILILSVFILAFAISALAYDIAVVDSNGNEYYHDGSYLFYLPSHITPDSVTFLVSDGAEVTYINASGGESSLVSGQSIDITPYISPFFSDTVYLMFQRLQQLLLDGYKRVDIRTHIGYIEYTWFHPT